MMFPIIQNDNLYRFCALIGLSILVFNTYYSDEMVYEIERHAANLKGEIFAHEQKSDAIIKDSTLTINHLEELEARANLAKSDYELVRTQLGDVNKLSIGTLKLLFEAEKNVLERKDILFTVYNENQKKRRELWRERNYIKTKTELYEIEMKRAERYNRFLFIGILISVPLTLYGFINWYLNQKLVDKDLLKAANKNEADN